MRYRRMYPAALCFAAFLAAIGLILDDPSNILPGLWKIMITEDALITDYMEIAGVGAAFVNSALVTLISIGILYLAKDPINGYTVVEIGLMAGFALFGKNIVNICLSRGTFLYAKLRARALLYVRVGLAAGYRALAGGQLCGAGQRLGQSAGRRFGGHIDRLYPAAPLGLYL